MLLQAVGALPKLSFFVERDTVFFPGTVVKHDGVGREGIRDGEKIHSGDHHYFEC